MFHHLVLLRFAPSSTPEHHQAVADALGDLPELIEEIDSYEVHLDAGLGTGNAHLSVHAIFADATAWRTYADHPAHQAVLRGQIEPILESATRTQYTDKGG